MTLDRLRSWIRVGVVTTVVMCAAPTALMSHHQAGHYGGSPPAWSAVTYPASAPAGISTPYNSLIGTTNDYTVAYDLRLNNGVSSVMTLNSFTALTHDTTGETLQTLWSFASDGDGVTASGIVSSAATIAQGHNNFVDGATLLGAGGVTITYVGNDDMVLYVTSRGWHVTDIATVTCVAPGTTVGSYTGVLDIAVN